jgi:hypothetical protein
MKAIIIPGIGGPRNGKDPINSLPLWATDKLNIAIKVWNDDKTIPIVLLSAGTCHKVGEPDINGRPIHECTAMALYLQSKGVNMKYVFEEDASYDTVGNAFFLRIIHTDLNEWFDLDVIVNEFHYLRLKCIFDWIFGNGLYKLNYIICKDPKDDVIEARKIKEAESLQTIQKIIKHVNSKSLKDIHTWLFSEHRLYASKYKIISLTDKIELNIDKRITASY